MQQLHIVHELLAALAQPTAEMATPCRTAGQPWEADPPFLALLLGW